MSVGVFTPPSPVGLVRGRRLGVAFTLLRRVFGSFMDEELKVLFCRLYLLDMLVEIMVLAEESEQHFYVAMTKPSDARRAISIIRTTIHKLIKKKSAHWHSGRDLIPPEANGSLVRLRALASFLESDIEGPLNLASSHLRNRQGSPSATQTVVQAARLAFEKFRSDLAQLRDAELDQVKLLIKPPAQEQPDSVSPPSEEVAPATESKHERWRFMVYGGSVFLALLGGAFQLGNSFYQHKLLSNTAEHSVSVELKRRIEVIRAQCPNLGISERVQFASARVLAAARGGVHYDGPSTGLGRYDLGEIVSELGSRGRNINFDDALHSAEGLLSTVSVNVSTTDTNKIFSATDTNKIWKALRVLDSFSITNKLFPVDPP